MADFAAENLVPASIVAPVSALAVSIPAEQIATLGAGAAVVVSFYEMRGIDSGTAAFTTWVATGAPDPSGTQATALNTTPPKVGAIVAGSGFVLGIW